MIGTDGGLVNAPVPVTRLFLAPGERYEIIVDLSADAARAAPHRVAANGRRTVTIAPPVGRLAADTVP